MKILRTIIISIIAILILPAFLSAKMMSVATLKANVRTGPSGGYDILWTVSKYTPFEIIGSKGKWQKVKDFMGDIGWMHISVLSDTPAMIVKTEQANLREDPGSKEILWVLDKTYPLKFIEKKGNWLHVKDDEISGWLHNTTVWGFTEAEQKPARK
ncbi:MAG: SH3 domain-containing protein [Elusimicrobiota bacterium]|nr:SH3 domain-containing protein [Elusimicrobiota bacterium]